MDLFTGILIGIAVVVVPPLFVSAVRNAHTFQEYED